MPHNRTRLWVGLAIAAVTIPAVGQYMRSTTNDSSRTALAANDRWTAGSGVHSVRPLASERTTTTDSRDYLAEVLKMTRRPSNPATTAIPSSQAIAEPNLDWMFDDSQSPYDEARTNELPDPAAAMAPQGQDGGSRETLDDSANAQAEDAQDSNEGVDDGPVLANVGPSDRDVYETMLASFSPEDRDTFVRAWAFMSPEQRAQVIDDYRNNN